MQDSRLPPPPSPDNPYAAPIAEYSAIPLDSPTEAERIRRELVKHEAGIQFLGSLYLLGALAFAGITVAVGFTVFLQQTFPSGAGGAPREAVLLLVLFALIAALYYWIGRGLRRLDRKVRKAAIVLSSIGLLGFPLATLLNAYFLYLLAGEKGKRVLSPQYQTIVAATPQIRYSSPWPVVALILVAAIVVIAAMVALANRGN